MFEDWLKVGDVLLYEGSDPISQTAVVVLEITDSYVVMHVVDEYLGRGSDVSIEKASHPNWNKRSNWIECGWKIL